MEGKTVDELYAGQRAQLSRTVTQADICHFAEVTGDSNPLHIDPVEAGKSVFGGPVAHGMLVAGLISAVIGTSLPGPGSVYLEQSLRFLKAVRPNDTVTATVEVIAVDAARNRVCLATSCSNQRGETVLTGEARVMPAAAGE